MALSVLEGGFHGLYRLFLGGSARRALKAEQAVERRFEADGKFATIDDDLQPGLAMNVRRSGQSGLGECQRKNTDDAVSVSESPWVH